MKDYQYAFFNGLSNETIEAIDNEFNERSEWIKPELNELSDKEKLDILLSFKDETYPTEEHRRLLDIPDLTEEQKAGLIEYLTTNPRTFVTDAAMLYLNVMVSKICRIIIKEPKAIFLKDYKKEIQNPSTTPERLKQIEQAINADNALSIYIFNVGIENNTLATISILEKRLKEDEKLKKLGIEYSQTLENIALLLILQRNQINIIDGYIGRAEELRKNFKIIIDDEKMFSFEKRKTYVTQKKIAESWENAGIKLTTVPDNIVTLSLDGYTRAAEIYTPKGFINDSETKAALIPTIDGIHLGDNGELLNRAGQDITKGFIESLESGGLQSRIWGTIIDRPIVDAGLALMEQYLEDGNADKELSVITVPALDFIKALYGESIRIVTKEKLEEIKERIEKVDVLGYLQTRNGVFLDKVMTWQGTGQTGESDKTITISFTIPHYERTLKEVRAEKERIEKKNKEKNEKEGKKKEPEQIAYKHTLIKRSLNQRQDREAADIVRILTDTIVRSGAFKKKFDKDGNPYTAYNKKQGGRPKKPNIKYKELERRIPALEKRVKESNNPTKTLGDIFNHVWKYLKEDTHITEEYPGIIFPGWNLKSIPELRKLKKQKAELKKNEKIETWIPGLKTMHNFKIELELNPQEKQLSRYEKQG